MLKEKKKLVEDIGVYYEMNRQLPPLAGRIYGLLMLCPKSGHSFDDIVELSSSSKSSVSTNINLLLSTGSIEYFTKPGERKRYFRLSKNYLEVELNKYADEVSGELKLLDKIEGFNKTHNKEKYKKHKAFVELYKEYLGSQYDNLRNTINKMNQLEKTV